MMSSPATGCPSSPADLAEVLAPDERVALERGRAEFDRQPIQGLDGVAHALGRRSGLDGVGHAHVRRRRSRGRLLHALAHCDLRRAARGPVGRAAPGREDSEAKHHPAQIPGSKHNKFGTKSGGALLTVDTRNASVIDGLHQANLLVPALSS